MEIHVVAPGETLLSIAQTYQVPLSQVLQDNQPPDPAALAVGQTLVIRFPTQTHMVQPGETVYSIARRYQQTVRQVRRNNPILEGGDRIWPGQTLVITYRQSPVGRMAVNGYAYPFVNRDLLRATLPYLTNMTPFTYGITMAGDLIGLDDAALIALSREGGVAPLMHLSTLTEEGGFSNELAHAVLNDAAVQGRLIEQVAAAIPAKGYTGLDVDFEYVFAHDALPYARFIGALAARLNPMGYPVIVALTPKTSPDQPGLLYEGHNYRALGEAANEVLLMTYEWGYTHGPPMAVAPLPNVRQVVQYALTEIPAEKIWLGIPNYGYDWPLPFVQGQTRATSISNQYAVSLAVRHCAEIQFDAYAQAPYFRYRDERGTAHEVWFEDARSIRAKLALIPEFRLRGAGYWNLMRPFPQNWRVLGSLYDIEELPLL